jgi:hypothetical protein
MKKMLSVLLVFVLAFGLFPAGSLAELEAEPVFIREIDIYGFRAPVAGGTPEHSYFLCTDENAHYFIVYQYWFDSTLNADITVEQAPFDPEHDYSAGCTVCPEDGYAIAEDCIFRINGSAKLADSSFTRPHDYLENLWIVQSAAVSCAEEAAAPAVTLSASAFPYTGKKIKPEVTVKNGDTVLKRGKDYSVAYSDNINAGTARVTVTLKGRLSGTAEASFRITRAEQEITVTKKNRTVKYSRLRKKAQTVTGAVAVTGARGKLSYAGEDESGYLSVSKKTGDITVAQGTPKGTYEIRITVTAKATANYKKAVRTVTVRIRVR